MAIVKLSILALIFITGSSAHFGGGRRGPPGGFGGFDDPAFQQLSSALMPAIQFFQNLNSTQKQSLLQIAFNFNATKAEVRQEIQEWAQGQSAEIQQQVNTILQNLDLAKQNITNYFDQKAANLSAEAKAVYDQYKAVYENENLSVLQECQELNAITQNITNPNIIWEFIRTFGALPKCPLGRGFGGRRGGFGGMGPGGFGGMGPGGFGGMESGGFGGMGSNGFGGMGSNGFGGMGSNGFGGMGSNGFRSMGSNGFGGMGAGGFGQTNNGFGYSGSTFGQNQPGSMSGISNNQFPRSNSGFGQNSVFPSNGFRRN